MSELDELRTAELDAAARDGKAKLVTNGDAYAVARWKGDGWFYAVANRHHLMQLDFEPTHYCP